MSKKMKGLLPAMLLVSCLSAEAAQAKDHIVMQKGKAFTQDEITVSVGDRIVFKNDDDTTHNVFSSSEGMKLNLGVQKKDSESSHAFQKAGAAEVRCAIHPKMKLKVVIKN